MAKPFVELRSACQSRLLEVAFAALFVQSACSAILYTDGW
jgi:hypothetical protein